MADHFQATIGRHHLKLLHTTNPKRSEGSPTQFPRWHFGLVLCAHDVHEVCSSASNCLCLRSIESTVQKPTIFSQAAKEPVTLGRDGFDAVVIAPYEPRTPPAGLDSLGPPCLGDSLGRGLIAEAERCAVGRHGDAIERNGRDIEPCRPSSVLKNWDRHLATRVSLDNSRMLVGASPIFQRPAGRGGRRREEDRPAFARSGFFRPAGWRLMVCCPRRRAGGLNVGEGQILAGIFGLGIGQKEGLQNGLAAQSMGQAIDRLGQMARIGLVRLDREQRLLLERQPIGRGHRQMDRRHRPAKLNGFQPQAKHVEQMPVGNARPEQSQRHAAGLRLLAIELADELEHSTTLAGQRSGEPGQQLPSAHTRFRLAAKSAFRRATPLPAPPASGRG